MAWWVPRSPRLDAAAVTVAIDVGFTRTAKVTRWLWLVAVVPWTAHAAGTAAPPGAGTILQDLKPLAPPAPSPDQPGLQIEQPQGRRALPFW
jgi:hypothetical protein